MPPLLQQRTRDGAAAPGFGFGLACPLQRQRPVYSNLPTYEME